jgi:serine/threonine-protein kinase
MRRRPLALFAAAMAATAAFVVATTPALPPTVATHFGGGGLADGWMTRDGYRLFILFFVVVLPLGMVAALGWLPRARPGWINIPNRDYWLAPERRDATADYLLGHACWLGVLMVALIAGIHYALLAANAQTPPRLSTPLFVALLLGFFLGLGLWIAALYRRLRR